MEQKDILEMNEEIQRQILEKMARMDQSSQQYKDLCDLYCKMADKYDQGTQTDLRRLDANAKTSIEEERIRIEQEKIILERSRIIHERWKLGVALITGFGTTILSYNYGLLEIPNKEVMKVKDWFMNRFFK